MERKYQQLFWNHLWKGNANSFIGIIYGKEMPTALLESFMEKKYPQLVGIICKKKYQQFFEIVYGKKYPQLFFNHF
jgi:hypothetical protein